MPAPPVLCDIDLCLIQWTLVGSLPRPYMSSFAGTKAWRRLSQFRPGTPACMWNWTLVMLGSRWIPRLMHIDYFVLACVQTHKQLQCYVNTDPSHPYPSSRGVEH